MESTIDRSRLVDNRTPVTVLTGFLGSGKTTILNGALRSPSLAGCAVIINEFGSVPLDHLLCEASDDKIVVLENGCLCCTVYGDLVSTLNRLYHSRAAGDIPAFDRVVIETSGLAEPTPVIQAFLSDPTLEGLYRLETVVTALDAVNGPGTLERHSESVHQLALADRVVVTKLELLGQEQAVERWEDLVRRVGTLNPGATLCRADAPGNEIAEWFQAETLTPAQGAGGVRAWLRAESYLPGPRSMPPDSARVALGGGKHSPESRIASCCLVREQPISLQGLELFLSAVERNLGPSLLRIKGLVNIRDRPGTPAVVHGVQHLLHNLAWLNQWPDHDQSTRIVFITDGIDTEELDDMIGTLDRVARKSASTRERAGGAPLST